MRLRIQDGILLKEYRLAWKPVGWGRRPPGWTPDDTGEWVRRQLDAHISPAVEAQALDDKAIGGLRASMAPHIAEKYGEVLHEQRKPWPGWVPVNPASRVQDKPILRAYRKLLAELNPDERPAGQMTWPDDGLYQLNKGQIEKLE